MERQTVLANIACRLGLIEQDEAEALIGRFVQRREEEGSDNGVPLSFEQFALAEEVWSVSALERLLTHFAASFFQCDSCGHPQRGQQLGPGPVFNCAMCGSETLSLRSGAVPSSQRTTQDSTLPTLSPEDAQKVAALVAEAESSENLEDVQQRLKELAGTLGPSREVTAALDGLARRIHEQRLAEAERLFFWGRIKRARSLISEARQWAPDDPRIAELEGRLDRVRYMLFGTGGLVCVVLLVMILGLLMRTDPEELRDEQLQAALKLEELYERIEALEDYLQRYRDDEAALEALDAAREEIRLQSLARVLAYDELYERRLGLENHLTYYPDDAEARRHLDAIHAALHPDDPFAEIEQAYYELRAIEAPAERARALANFLREHEATTLPPNLIDEAQSEIMRANLEAVRERARDELRDLDPWQRHARLRTLEAELVAQDRRGMEQALLWVANRVDEAADDIQAKLAQAGRRLPTAEAAHQFLRLLEQSKAAIPDVRARFADEVDLAQQRITEKQELAVLKRRAEEAATWYEAEALLTELERLSEEVPRVAPQLAAVRESLEPLVAERPPEVPGFVALRIERFEAGGQSHRVHVYRHERFAEAYELPKVPAAPRERGDAAAAFTRPEVEFVLLPPLGTEQMHFWMGSPETEDGRRAEETLHEVTLTRPFLIARTTVTQRVWAALAAEVPGLPTDPSWHDGEDLPVETVTWRQARQFTGYLNLRLPTEAQWEYAARAGTQTPFTFGETLPGSLANTNTLRPYGDAERETPRRATLEVANLPANAFGLFEVHGNVWEWCADWSDRLPSEAVTDPTGPSRGSAKVLRGGSYLDPPEQARSAARTGLSPTGTNRRIGLRPATYVPEPD